jgi:hypothetical protein
MTVALSPREGLGSIGMALSEIEQKRVEKLANAFVERRRPPAHVRDELDLGYRVSGQSLEIFEIRPLWNNPSEKIEKPVAKATYVRRTDTWKVYWQRRDLKWHRYDPDPEVATLEEFLRIVDEDEFAAFWG